MLVEMQILGPKTRVLLDYINCLGSRLELYLWFRVRTGICRAGDASDSDHSKMS